MVWIGKQAYRLVNADIDNKRFNLRYESIPELGHSELNLVLDLKHSVLHLELKMLNENSPSGLNYLAARSRGQMTKKALRKKQRRKRKKLEAT
jgi:hypothetical protein